MTQISIVRPCLSGHAFVQMKRRLVHLVCQSSIAAGRMTYTHSARWWLYTLLAASIALTGASDPSFCGNGNTDYRLWAQDKVRVTVFEWRPSKDELFEWKAINGEYAVQPNGNVSIPLIGEVRAAGLSAAELASNIGDMIKERTGLAQSPAVSAEIVLFRPIYITGQVERPGEFAYRPNILVLQAVALSGGIRRTPPDTRINRELITARSDLKQLAAVYRGLLARKARFETEIADGSELIFPAELTTRMEDKTVLTLMQRERALFEARRSANQNQIRTLKDLQQYLHSEIDSIQAQLTTHNRQIELVKKELDGVNSLVTKGLAIEPRRLGLERNIAQLEGDRLRLESSITRSRQEINRTALSILELSTKREIDAATGLTEVQAKIEEVTQRFEATRGLLHDAEILAGGEQRAGVRVVPIFTIIRQDPSGMAIELNAADTTPVLPGDTIKVDLPVAHEEPAGTMPSLAQQKKHPS